jgi:hypothetical protein
MPEIIAAEGDDALGVGLSDLLARGAGDLGGSPAFPEKIEFVFLKIPVLVLVNGMTSDAYRRFRPPLVHEVRIEIALVAPPLPVGLAFEFTAFSVVDLISLNALVWHETPPFSFPGSSIPFLSRSKPGRVGGEHCPDDSRMINKVAPALLLSE